MLRGLGKHFRSLFVPAPRGDTSTPGYHAYVTLHDWIVPSSKLSSAIGRLSDKNKSALDSAWAELQSGLAGWKTKNLILAADTAAEIRDRVPESDLRDTAICILFDQSGSMRGQKMLYAAASADIVQELLSTLGIKVELLGFTTCSWRGGQSRRIWNDDGRPPNPGRLNDLLHVIYRDATDNRQSSMGAALQPMLRPDLPKENIDGEAIEWASGRLRERPEARKILLVVSDGAPVDDATLLANGTHYLHDHLLQVIGELEAAGDIELLAIGLGFAAERYYRVSAHCKIPYDLAGAMLALLRARLITGQNMQRQDRTLRS